MKEAAISTIVTFWFDDCAPKQWFGKDDAFDQMLNEKFGKLVQDALSGRLDSWAQTPDGSLALILLLDQMTRNIYRDTPLSFAGDEMALAHALQAIDKGYLDELPSVRNLFRLMPLMHSEERAIHEMAAPLFAKYAGPQSQDSLRRHTDIIMRFDRYPHRNAILGRPSSEAEKEFLTKPGSSF